MIAGTLQLPIGYRAAAVAITVLVHALVLFLALFLHAGSRGQQHSIRANSVGEEIIQIEFLPARRNIAPGKVAKSALTTAAQDKQTPSLQLSDPGMSSKASASGNHASRDNKDNDYISAVRAAVISQWQMDGGSGALAGCKIAIDQIKGGKAVRAWIVNCSALTARNQIQLEIAVMRAQLPYDGFESLFQDHLELEL